MTFKRVQRNIYKQGNRIWVKKMCYKGTSKQMVVIPAESVHDGVAVLDSLAKHEYDLDYAQEVKEKQRKKLEMSPIKKGKGELRNIYKNNKHYIVQKMVNGKKLTWNCNSLEEAIRYRDEFEKKGWSTVSPDRSYTPKRGTQSYSRFEEVKEFPRLHIPSKDTDKQVKQSKPTQKVEKPTAKVEPVQNSSVKEMAKKYNISYEEMTQLCVQIGIRQLQKLNFIPEYGD
jgi:hypothetical protein